jgi:hypothetical protein
MRCISVRSETSFGALAALLVMILSVNAQPNAVPSHLQPNDASPPPGSMMWHYECNGGTQCPTTCTIKGNQVFTTSDYASFTITQIPNQVFWFQVDTGDKAIDYVVQSDQVVCSISGAVLKAARASASSEPRPRQ